MKTDDKLHWYVIYTKACQEKKVAEWLAKYGIEYYLAIQKEKHKWSDRYKIVDRLVIPRVIFLHTTYSDRMRPLKDWPGLYRFLTDNGPYTPAVVPDREMDMFRRMVSKSATPVTLSDPPIQPGTKIRVKKGPLSGLEAELIEVNSRQHALVRLGKLGAASAEIAIEDIEPVKSE